MTTFRRAYLIAQFHDIPAFTYVSVVGAEDNNVSVVMPEGGYPGPVSISNDYLSKSPVRAKQDAIEECLRIWRDEQRDLQREKTARIEAARRAIEAEYRDTETKIGRDIWLAGMELAALIDESLKPHKWEGKKVQRTIMVFAGRFSSKQVPKVVYGIIETVTKDTKFVASKRYGLPDKGDVIVRALKKDGTAALTFDTFSETAGWSLAE